MDSAKEEKQECLIEILSGSKLVSWRLVQVPEGILNVESLARFYLEKLLSAAIYSSTRESASENGGITSKSAVTELGHKNGFKYLRVSLDSDAGRPKTCGQFIKHYATYSVPLYVPAILLLLCASIYKPAPDEVCFAHIGCLELAGPWTQRIVFNHVPQSPALVNTTFTLSSRQLPDGYKFSPTLKDPNVTEFDWSKSLNIIVHGYTDNATTWIRNLSSSLLDLGDVNVLAVDWSPGADMSYPQSVANTRVVAAQVVVFLEHLTEIKGETIGDINIIGHSLGAHIAGYVGKRFPGVARIFGLDPAAPLFEGFDPEVRLNEKDAKEVIVLHTNISPLGFGIREPIGTVDIYANNGQDQHGCIPMMELLFSVTNAERLLNMRESIACSHRRAYEFLAVVLRGHPLNAYPCPLSVILSNDTESCWSLCGESDGCLSIDEITSKDHKVFYLPTSDRQPYCIKYVSVEAKTCAKQKPILDFKLKGTFDVTSTVLHDNMLTKKQRMQSLIPITCGALNETTIRLQLAADITDSVMTESEACFSYFQISYVDDNGNLVSLRRGGVRVMPTDQCTQIEFTNSQAS